MLPNELSNHTSARILERQSTFVRFVTKNSMEYKVSYVEKLEYLIEELEFVGIVVTEEHPILEHYQQNKFDIFLSSKIVDPHEIVGEFAAMVKSEYEGWRSVKECFNSECSLTSLLEGGYGMLYSGPEILAKKVEHALQRNDIKYKSVPHKVQKKPQMKALLMGANIVVAKDFRIEKVPS